MGYLGHLILACVTVLRKHTHVHILYIYIYIIKISLILKIGDFYDVPEKNYIGEKMTYV